MGEPYLSVSIYSKDSRNHCQKSHRESYGYCDNFGRQGTWRDHYFRLRGGEFPSCLPLRFFIKPDGNFKEDGDTLKLSYKGQLIILTCEYRKEKFDGEAINSFAGGIAKRVAYSLGECGNLLQADVDTAKTMAQTNTQEWIADSEG